MKRIKIVGVLVAAFLTFLATACVSMLGYDYRVSFYEAPGHEQLATVFVHRSASALIRGEPDANALLGRKIDSARESVLLDRSQTLNGDQYFFYVLVESGIKNIPAQEIARLRNQSRLDYQMKLTREVKGWLRDETTQPTRR